MEERLRYEMDLERFWRDNELALEDNCFNAAAPQVAFGLNVLDECVFAELGVEGDFWGDTDPALMRDHCRRYNDRARRIVGRRLLSEHYPRNHQKFPKVKLHGEVFGGRYTYRDGMYWLESDIETPAQLEKMLDRVDGLDIRRFILPEDWEAGKKRAWEETGERPTPEFYGRKVRGPTTLATSIFGVENLIFLMVDQPELAHRFFDKIGDVILEYVRILDEEWGGEDAAGRWGFRFYDDNCCLLTAELYEEFVFPVLDRVFTAACPAGEDLRYQHSDSPMAHLLPVLARLDLHRVNFGPTVLLDQIRAHMPTTRVDGCLDPILLLSNNEEEIIRQVRRDCEMARALGTRGLCIDAAGSVNNGTKLTTVRAVMYAVQRYGRY